MSTANSSPSIADNAHELIRDLYLNPDILPPYNSELMQKCEFIFWRVYTFWNYHIIRG